jgi:sterol desaturase/sphingolipid hydroxylase (fatty acid hydroxylase superfamily)
MLYIIDYFKLLLQYKVQENIIANTNVLNDTYRKAINVVLKNSLIHIIPACLFLGVYEYGYSGDFSFLKFCFDVLVSRILVDIFFYSIHRLLHKNFFYHALHKKHHEITTPVGITSIYMTITDLYIGNILPIYLPLLILNSHPLTVKFWMIATTLNTVVFAHSGFKKIAEAHDYHHSHFSKNFGTDLFMDRLFGTYHYESD